MISERIGKFLWCLDLFYTILLLDFMFYSVRNWQKLDCLENGFFFQNADILSKKDILSESGHFI